MTHSVQTSTLFNHGKIHSRRYYPANFYQVVVNTEEGEFYEYEVEADSFAEATEKAEEMAHSLMENITFIEVYDLEHFNSTQN